jgi:hypothetical protein
VLLAAVVAGALGIDAGLVRGLGVHAVLTPDAQAVVQNFVKAMAAGRWEIARAQLDEATRSRVSVADLRAADAALRRRHGAYRLAPGGRSGEARYQGVLRTSSGAVLELGVGLGRDPRTGLLQIGELPALLRGPRARPGAGRQLTGDGVPLPMRGSSVDPGRRPGARDGRRTPPAAPRPASP